MFIKEFHVDWPSGKSSSLSHRRTSSSTTSAIQVETSPSRSFASVELPAKTLIASPCGFCLYISRVRLTREYIPPLSCKRGEAPCRAKKVGAHSGQEFLYQRLRICTRNNRAFRVGLDDKGGVGLVSPQGHSV